MPEETILAIRRAGMTLNGIERSEQTLNFAIGRVTGFEGKILNTA
jgi:hypothetical protein